MKRKDHPNYRRWLQPPTIEQIEAVVKKADVSESQFERYNGIYGGAIKKARSGERSMPVQYWHIFLDPSENSRPKMRPKQALVRHIQPSRAKSTTSLNRLVS